MRPAPPPCRPFYRTVYFLKVPRMRSWSFTVNQVFITLTADIVESIDIGNSARSKVGRKQL